MVKAVKRKHVELADKTSLSAMTPADIKIMNAEFGQIASNAKLADRMIKLLTDQKGLSLGCHVDLFEHGLQTATRCFNDLIARTPKDAKDLTPAGLSAADEELVVVALLHDIGETYSPINHGEMAAGMLRPFISPRNYWILMHHEIFGLLLRRGGRLFDHLWISSRTASLAVRGVLPGGSAPRRRVRV